VSVRSASKLHFQAENSAISLHKGVSSDLRDAVRRYALQCVAVDFRLFGATPWTLGDTGNEGNQKINAMTFDELLSEIHKQVPVLGKRTSKRYLKKMGDKGRPQNIGSK
jgi:hypothetical protein